MSKQIDTDVLKKYMTKFQVFTVVYSDLSSISEESLDPIGKMVTGMLNGMEHLFYGRTRTETFYELFHTGNNNILSGLSFYFPAKRKSLTFFVARTVDEAFQGKSRYVEEELDFILDRKQHKDDMDWSAPARLFLFPNGEKHAILTYQSNWLFYQKDPHHLSK